MRTAAVVLLVACALLHAWFLVLEMFLWTTPRGRRTFGTTVEEADATRTLAGNQGLYNGFLAAGLLWGAVLVAGDGDPSGVALFFPICVVVAGVYGALTVSRKILYVQALPALVALALVAAIR
jgi:putative membrane protein